MSGYMPTTPRHFNTHDASRPGVGLRGITSIRGWLLFLARQFLKRRKIARDIAWLQNAPAHHLNDIGLSRDDIDRACKTGHKLDWRNTP